MDENAIQGLLHKLFMLKYRSSYSNSMLDVISRDQQDRVEQVIRQWALEQNDARLAVLEAKCFTYEQIISKSNFAPMINPNNTKLILGD